MSRIVVLAFLGIAATASADRLISVPTGRKIPYGYGRYELRAEPHPRGDTETLFGFGIGKSFDAEFRTSHPDRSDIAETIDFSYNLVAPIPELSPGISFGVQDAANRTQDGRRCFAAITFRPVQDTLNGAVPADVTFGVLKGKQTLPFVGLSLPLSKEFRLLAEHNGLRIAAGVEIRPVPSLGFRFQVREKQTFASVQISSRF